MQLRNKHESGTWSAYQCSCLERTLIPQPSLAFKHHLALFSTVLGHSPMAMFLFLLSLINVCVADLDAKGACALQTQHRLEEGAAARKVSVTCDSDELICYDQAGHTQSCHPKSAGCPVTCPAGEHVCHTPAYCDGCDAYNWCSMSPCPLYCSMSETLCHDSTTMTDSCHPKSAGCPVTCAAGEHVCHTPPSCDTCDGYNWCSPSTCPLTCASDEVVCYDSNTMTESCHPMSTGCPVTCAAGEHVCHSPPTCETCHGYSWCSTASCPITCGMNETLCHDSTTMTDSCHPASTGCPVTCPAGEHVCHSPPMCEGCLGYNWCSPSTCPITCGMDEIVCHDSTTMTDSCHPMSTGCPVTCAAGEHMCHGQGYNWCSTTPCPITCGMDEVMCHDSTTMTDSCHPVSTGCPVTCAAGEHVCHSPPTCQGCHGYNWCSSSTCPITCGANEMSCWDSVTMTDSCYPMSTGCPVTCAAGEHVCSVPATCQGCTGYSYCSMSPCT